MDTSANKVIAIDPNLNEWLPWAWNRTVAVSSKILDGCDYVGEYLANFFGITSPKYQFEIDAYYRNQELEQELKTKEDLEMAGWKENKYNGLITSDKELL